GLLGRAFQGAGANQLLGQAGQMPQSESRTKRNRDEQAGRHWVAPAPAPKPFYAANGARPNWFACQKAPQVVGQFLGRGVTACRSLGHGLETNGLQVSWDLIVELPRRTRLISQDLKKKHLPVSAERPLAGQEFIEDDPEAINVGPAINLVCFP